MAGTVSAANIRLGADISGLLSGLRTATQAVNRHADGVNLGLTRAYREADTASRAFRGGIGRLGGELKDIGQQMALIGTLPAIFAAGAAFKSFADMQKLTIGLKQYGETIDTVKDLAKLPNIGIEGAAKSLIQLRAVGVESDLAKRAIKAFGNAMTAAGKSSEDLNPALTNVVQFLSTGVVSAADVKELANRIPQTRKALMDAFGTASGEALTKIGPENVVKGLITELEKIPPVSGGAGMAMEKFADSAQFAAATMGETIDKAFGLTGIISSLADQLGDTTDSFADLSPDTQKFILSLGGLTAIAPLVVIAMGMIVSAGAAIATGLGIAASTVGIIVSAFVIGGALIITYWDDIKATLTDAGVWTTLASFSEQGGRAIVNVFKAAGNLISGDWSAMWNSLKNVLVGVTNAMSALVMGVFKQIGLLTGSIVGLLGADNLGKKIREWSHGLDDVLKKLNLTERRTPGQSVVSTSEYGKQFADDDAETKAWEERKSRIAKIKPVTDVASMSIKELGERLATLKDSYENLKPGEANYVQSKDSIAKQVRQVTNLIDSQSKSLNTAKKHIKENTEAYDKMTEAEFKLWSINLDSKYYQEQKAIEAAENSLKGYTRALFNFNVEAIKSQKLNLGGKPLDLKGRASEISDIGKLGGSPATAQDGIQSSMDRAANEYQQKVAEIENLNNRVKDSVADTMTDLGYTIAEGLGDALSGEGSIADTGKKIILIFAEALKSLGKAMIAWAAAKAAAKLSLSLGGNPIVAAVAGAAAVVAGTVLTNKMEPQTRFAKGGFAYNEVNAIVGDNPNARFDPEMIAPYSKVDSSIKRSIAESGVNNGGAWEQTGIELSGDVIRIALERNNKKNTSLTGKRNS